MLGVPVPGRLAAVLMNDTRIVKANGTVRVSIEKVDLFLQLIRRDPVVVAIEQGNVFAARGVDSAGHDGVAMNVLLRQQQPDLAGMLLRVRDDGLACAVGRAVLTDEDFVVEVSALS